MRPQERSRFFAGRYALAGALVWIFTIQYFLAQVVVAAAWDPSYSWRLDAISDLGARSCGRFDGRMVCSPLHGMMNVSFVVLGLCMTVGSLLLARAFHSVRAGFALMAVAGLGAVLVGFFPEDTVFWAHITGADVAFLIGNVALVVFGLTLRVACWFRWYSIASGVIALIALVLFLTHHRFFLDLGGMERVVASPQTIWLIAFGAYVLAHRDRPTGRRVEGSTA